MTEPTDAELTECYKAANGEDVGKAQPLTTQRIFRAMRAAIAKWGTPPAVAGEPAFDVRVGALPTMTQDEYPGLGDWWVQLRLGPDFDQVLARVYGASPDEARWRAFTIAARLGAATQAQAGAVPLTCEWAHNEDDGFWDTECGQSWRFDDGGPKENHMNFCHCCGKPLRIKGGQHGAE